MWSIEDYLIILEAIVVIFIFGVALVVNVILVVFLIHFKREKLTIHIFVKLHSNLQTQRSRS